MKTKILFASLGLIGVLALLGGTWQLTALAVTVPPYIPPAPVTQPSTPVTGEGEVTTTDSGNGAVVEIADLATVSIPPNTLAPGSVIKAVSVLSSMLPENDMLDSIGSIVHISIDQNGEDMTGSLSSSMNVVMTLTAEQVEAFKKDPKMGVQWYDPEKKEWVKIPATLMDGKISFNTKQTGYFAFASQK